MTPMMLPATFARRRPSQGWASQAFKSLENASNRVRNAVVESVVNVFTCSIICTCWRESKLTTRRYQRMRRLSKRADQLLS